MKQDKAAQEAIIGGFNNLRQVVCLFLLFYYFLGILEGLYFVKMLVLIYKLAGPH